VRAEQLLVSESVRASRLSLAAAAATAAVPVAIVFSAFYFVKQNFPDFYLDIFISC